ncbi:MAG: hypothetical protein EBY18_00320 [Alphaproteobacteria bacterium]|nr:hypothetical protein [Alphaproteobacteria bacterium]
MHVALHRRTTYLYDRPVALGPQVGRLRPAPHARPPMLSYSLNVTPGKMVFTRTLARTRRRKPR